MDYAAREQQATIEMVEGRRPWPHGDVLPMKKRQKDGRFPVTAYIKRPEPGADIVILDYGNTTEIARFKSTGELLADGWVVD
jgi:hypothetical protein